MNAGITPGQGKAISPKEIYKKRSQTKEVWHRLKRNKLAVGALCTLILLVIIAIFAKQIAPYGYDEQNISIALNGPGVLPGYPLGTDSLGRDLLSRIIWGTQVSLRVGVIAVTISAVGGCILGAIAGFFGSKLDNLIMRCMDILMAIPGILLAIAIAATLGPGMTNAIIAVGISGIAGFARIVRSSVLSVRDMEYIEAARAINASNSRILIRHILPNIMAPIIVQVTLGFANAILQAASLSFLGLGAQPPIPEWGALISGGRSYMRDYGYMVTMPGIAIMITVFAINLFGDGLRDALDPRLKH